MSSADVSAVDPAFDGASITLDGILGHGFFSVDGVLFTYPQADLAAGAAVVIDHRFLLHQLYGVHRTIPHAKPATDAFVVVNYHNTYWFGWF